MKWYLGFMALVMVLVALEITVWAAPIDLDIVKLEDPPEAQAGMIISFKKQGIEATATAKIIGKDFSWGRISFNAGAAPAINEPIVSLTYRLPADAMEKWGVDIPYAKLLDIQAGVYVGFEVNEYQNNPDDEWYKSLDGGAAVIGASLKF